MQLTAAELRTMFRLGTSAKALIYIAEVFERRGNASALPSAPASAPSTSDTSEAKRIKERERKRLFRLKSRTTSADATILSADKSPTPPFLLTESSTVSIPKEVMKKKKEPIVITREEEDGFERFKANYPKRQGGMEWSEARPKHVRAVRSGVSADVLADKAAEYRACMEAQNNIGTPYVKMPAVWLNKKGWEDDYEITTTRINGKAPRLNSVDRATAELLDDLDRKFGPSESAGGDSPGQRLAQDVPRLR